MKKIFINKIMNYIVKNSNYSKNELLEIEYGLTGIYLTISKMIIIFIVAYLLGIFRETIFFMTVFNIIRTTAFGLHATKSWICLISSTIIFIGVPLIAKYIIINSNIKLVVGIISILFIYKNAPADTKKRPIVNKKRRLILKLISTLISISFVISSLIINNSFISNCLIFAIMIENCLISPLVYKIFDLPYNNYIEFFKSHPDLNN